MPWAEESGARASNTGHLRCSREAVRGSPGAAARCTGLPLAQRPNACRIGGSNSILLAAQRQTLLFLQPLSSAPCGASAPRSSRGQRPSPRAWPEPEPAPGSVCRVLRPHLAGSGVSERGELRARDSAWLGSRAPCYTPQRYVRGDD